MDTSQLAQRLESLALSNPQGSAATPSILSYFFTPKSGSVHPAKPETALKLVVVALEAEKNVGPAKLVAASAGLKDMRAISPADLEKLIQKTKEFGQSKYWLWSIAVSATGPSPRGFQGRLRATTGSRRGSSQSGV